MVWMYVCSHRQREHVLLLPCAKCTFGAGKKKMPPTSSPRDTASRNLRLRLYSMPSTSTAVRAQAFFEQPVCSGAHAFISPNSQSRVSTRKKNQKVRQKSVHSQTQKH